MIYHSSLSRDELIMELAQLQKTFKEISDEHDRVEAENARLRQALEDAPHDEDCKYTQNLLRFNSVTGVKMPNQPCDCWKAAGRLPEL